MRARKLFVRYCYVICCLATFMYLPSWVLRLPAEFFSITSDFNCFRLQVFNDSFLNDAYCRSPSVPNKNVFVGDQPFFPPCVDLPQGLPLWGQYGYLRPMNYINKSKNPCWYGNGMILRCVPYFFLAGVSKSGTRDLFHRMTLHPEIVMSDIGKAPRWFTRSRYIDYKSFDEYSFSFNNVALLVEDDIKKYGFGKHITGDGTVNLFFESFKWPLYSGNEGCTEPRVILAHHIRHLYPEAKIIFIFRHPVTRLYSKFQRSTSLEMIPSAALFHAVVVDAISKYRECFARWSMRHCIYNESLFESTHRVGFQENLYSELLEDWLRVFPRQQILFLRYEDYVTDIKSHLLQVFDFLKVDRLDNKTLEIILKASVQNQGNNEAGPMLNETRVILEEFFNPFIKRFSSMIGDKKFTWADFKHKIPSRKRKIYNEESLYINKS